MYLCYLIKIWVKLSVQNTVKTFLIQLKEGLLQLHLKLFQKEQIK